MIELPITAKVLPLLLAGWLSVTSIVPFPVGGKAGTNTTIHQEDSRSYTIVEKVDDSTTDRVEISIQPGHFFAFFVYRKPGHQRPLKYQSNDADIVTDINQDIYEDMEKMTSAEKAIVMKWFEKLEMRNEFAKVLRQLRDKFQKGGGK